MKRPKAIIDDEYHLEELAARAEKELYGEDDDED